MCKGQIAIYHYIVERRRNFLSFESWVDVFITNAWDCFKSSFGWTKVLHYIKNESSCDLLMSRCGSLLKFQLVQVSYYSYMVDLVNYSHAANASFYFIDSASWTWSHPLSLCIARDEQESKLGKVDECIFASCLILLFCIVVVGSWYFTAFARTFYVCFH